MRAWSALAYLIPVPAFPVAFFVHKPGLWGLRFHAAQSVQVALAVAIGWVVSAANGGPGTAILLVPVGLSMAVAAGLQPKIPGLRRVAEALANLGCRRD